MAGEHINDLWRDWLLKANRIAAVDFANLLQLGTIYQWDSQFSLASLDDFVISFTTGDVPVAVYQMVLDFTGTDAVTFQGFVGGTVSGGTEITEVFPLNHDNPGQSPYLANSVFEGRTIDVPGVEFMDATLLQASRNNVSSSESGGLILAENQLYYFTVTNIGNQAGTFNTDFVAGAIIE